MDEFLAAIAAAAAILILPFAVRPKPAGFDRLPWFTLALAAFAALNPLGIEIIKAVAAWSPTDWLRQLWLAVLAGAVLLLVLIGAIECAIRSLRARKRAQAAGAGPGQEGNAST
jgi:hypothetical protein